MPGTQNDLHQQLQDEVLQAKATGSCLAIQGGGSKQFYGRKVAADKVLNTAAHQGIISYEPAELFIQARAGTTLTEIHKTLTEGQVMKNVAGYDVSRLMVGALGTLGVIMDASIKVVPIPEAEITLMQETSIETALSKLHEWSRLPLGISASCFYKNKLYLRLSGTEKAIYAAVKKIGGEPLNQADEFWQSISNQSHVFFQNEQSLWRLSLASNTPPLFTNEDTLYEWGGALRWLKSDVAQQTIRADSHLINGHSTLFRSSSPHDAVFQPLAPPLLKLHQRLKQAFDPQGIFNIGRMYPDF